MSEKLQRFYATGRRKSAVARVWLAPGSGKIIVNERAALEYFKRDVLTLDIEEPFALTETKGRFDVIANVSGGGLTGQAGALRYGITRALMKVNPQYRPVLKKAGLVTRDPRVKERKKYGRPGARKRFQYSKR